jgi:hypothetical protein
MKKKSTKTLQIIVGVYAIIYLTGIISWFFESEVSFLNLKDSAFFLLFFVFMLGFALSWTREKIAGIILMIWNVFVWILDLFLSRGPDSGMLIIMAAPVLIFGAVLTLRWYKTSRVTQPSLEQQWKFILRILLLNYSLLYVIYLIADIIYEEPINLLTIPGIIFPVILILFLVGFILSWKYELYAGIVFIIWYCVVLSSSICYSEISTRGPIAMFGVTILVQGIIYINNHFNLRLKQS